MSSEADRKYIEEKLLAELQIRMRDWSVEYRQERDLGYRGEFVGLYRKARKIKTIVWDGAPESNFREGVRTMLFEIVAHALLMLCDWDRKAESETLPSESPLQKVLGSEECGMEEGDW